MAPGPGDKTPGPGEDARVARTRADVSRAALGVLTDEGSDAVTHARVAELAGYSKTTLYTHWPSRVDLIVLAVDALGELPHHERTGNLRDDIIGELEAFRGGITEMRLDLILTGMAQWASVEEMRVIRDKINNSGQGQMRAMLGEILDGAELEAALSMLTGVVACPSIMFGTLPDDDVIAAAVDIVLRSAQRRKAFKR
ncbi:TetR/AcrR family transcriptional regulator [Mycobacterium cookii]|uniref:Putative HTH-type transcriptional regulator n=1 Tax=Mycobacterium cookii TaxID=1775 RepID=A0A7I7KT42_9MYCO|nr:TetR/AcrR family transcriptional regulator [Mycobacterium cookii]MCV7331127.1 TetR/AcrR family transcriptional regulator [Mycobacterium cookii]BBX44919.1 putative HTH-type transcriptional regulator [Mycobacterium cookii]